MARLRVRELLDSRGIKLAQLYRTMVEMKARGEIADVISMNTLSTLVNTPDHMPNVATLALLAQVLEVRVSDLLDESIASS